MAERGRGASIDDAIAASGGPDIAAFVLFLVLGVAFIIAAKSLAAPAFVVTGVPILVMLVYASLLAFVPRFGLRTDQSGDNLYYLGFLYTLTSLGVSLYQFTADGSAEMIVRNFGVAIGSTITGVALRVLFGQMRRDPVDIERVSRLELADAARRVRRELDSTVVEMAHFRRGQEQAVRDSFIDIAKRTEAAGVAMMAALEETSRKASAPLDAAAERAASTLDQLVEAIGAVLNGGSGQVTQASVELARATTEVVDTFEALAKRVAALHPPESTVGVRLDPITERLLATLEAMARRSDAEASRLREAVSALSEATRDLRRTSMGVPAGAFPGVLQPRPAAARPTSSAPMAGGLAALVAAPIAPRTDDEIAAEAAEAAAEAARREPELPLFSEDPAAAASAPSADGATPVAEDAPSVVPPAPLDTASAASDEKGPAAPDPVVAPTEEKPTSDLLRDITSDEAVGATKRAG